jgi:hypothetical protein
VKCLVVKVTEENMTQIASVSEKIHKALQESVSKNSFAQTMVNFYHVNDITQEESMEEVTQNVSILIVWIFSSYCKKCKMCRCNEEKGGKCSKTSRFEEMINK